MKELIITQALQIALPILITFFLGLAVKNYNKFMEAKIESMKANDSLNKAQTIRFLESARIDQDEIETLNQWVKEGIQYATEVYKNTYNDPSKENLTGEQKFEEALNYIQGNIKTYVKDPQRKAELEQLAVTKIKGLLPVMNEQMDLYLRQNIVNYKFEQESH